MARFGQGICDERHGGDAREKRYMRVWFRYEDRGSGKYLYTDRRDYCIWINIGRKLERRRGCAE